MTKNNVRYWITLSTGLLFCAGYGTAWAQTAPDKAAADALFNEGKQLVNKPDDAVAWATACEKFEASLAKVTQLGTQIALASCYEKLGKTASALGVFRAAASAASKAQDNKRQRFAEEHATALEAKLSKIVIRLETSNRIAGLEVKRDGAVVTPAEFDVTVPVDPGEHIIEASAPGRIGWWTKVSISSTSRIVEVPVPGLEKVPDRSAALRTRRTITYLVEGGIAVTSASLIFGTAAYVKWSTAESHHCSGGMCDQRGVDLAGSARTMGHVATGTFLFGAGAVAAGVILFLITPSVATEKTSPASTTALHVVPNVGFANVGLTIQGGF